MKIKKFYIYLISFILILITAVLSLSAPQRAYADSSYDYRMVSVNYPDGVTGTTKSYSFGYSDSLFENNRENGTLAKASIAMAAAAYSTAKEVKTSIEKLGFNIVLQANYEKIATEADCDFVAYTIASKEITLSGGNYVLYGVFIRGTDSNGEWYSNFNVGETSEHYGFYTAAEEVYQNLLKIVENKENAKIWITGHSRGASVSNVLASKINLNENIAYRENVCAYTFACPANSTKAVAYNNIFNYNVSGDIVAAMPLKEWGFKTHGVTTVLSTDLKMQANVLFKEWTGQDYAGGDDVQQFSECMLAWCPTQQAYVNPEYGSLGSSPYGLIKKIIPVLMGENMEPITLADVAFNFKALSVLLYFQQNQTAIIQAHSQITYLAFMEALYPHEHVYNYVSDGNMTCTQDGTKTGTCYCGNVVEGVKDEGSATGHSFIATVDSNGIITYDCEYCDKVFYGKDISFAVSTAIPSYEYLGEEITPQISLTFNGEALIEGEDYEISYRNNGGVGTAQIVVIGENSYSGYKIIEFEIREHVHTFGAYKPNNDAVCGVDGTKSATCSVCGEVSTLHDEGSALVHDYVLQEDGETFICSLCSHSFIGKNLSYCEVIFDKKVELTSSSAVNHIDVYFMGTLLKEGVDYTVTYQNNGSVGTASFILNGLGDYFGEYVAEFEVVEHVHEYGEYSYNGDATCVDDGTETAYCSTCNGEDTRVKRGSATGHDYEELIADGEGGTEDENKITYVCSVCGDVLTENDITKAKFQYIGEAVYHGSAITPLVTVVFLNQTLEEGVHYELTYSDNNAVGTGKITVTGIGDYTGEAVLLFDIIEHTHVYNNYVSDGNATCYEDGTKTSKCDECNKTDTVTDEGSVLTHEYVAGNSVNGEIKNTCKHCGDEYLTYDLSFAEITPFGTVYYYGKPVTPQTTLYFNGEKLVYGRDYDIAYLNNSSEGEGAAIFTGKGDYVGSVRVSFTIEQYRFIMDNYVYNGDATCTEDGTQTGVNKETGMTETVVAVGTALGHNYENTGIIDGREEYTCSRCQDKIYKIHMAHVTVEITEDGLKDGYLISGGLSVSFNGERLVEGAHYTYMPKYEKFTDEGIMRITVTVRGINDCTGEGVYVIEVDISQPADLTWLIVLGSVLGVAAVVAAVIIVRKTVLKKKFN